MCRCDEVNDKKWWNFFGRNNMNLFERHRVAFVGMTIITLLSCFVSVSESFSLNISNHMHLSLTQSRRFSNNCDFMKQSQQHHATVTSSTLASSSNDVVEMNGDIAIDEKDVIDVNNLSENIDAFELIASLT